MVDLELTVGAVFGVVISGGFVLLEIGRYATPQVPETLFDERREVFAYTAGLFVGVPLALAFLFFIDSMAAGALPGAILWLVALVGATEVAQWALLRTRYWGQGESRPFYALGYRAGIAGILALAIVAQYLSGPSIDAFGIALVLLQGVAVLGLEVAGALVGLPPGGTDGRRRGGPLAAVLFGAVGFFLLGVGPLAGSGASGLPVAFAAALVALIGGNLVYARLRPILANIPAPSSGGAAPLPRSATSYGRTDRGPGGPPS